MLLPIRTTADTPPPRCCCCCHCCHPSSSPLLLPLLSLLLLLPLTPSGELVDMWETIQSPDAVQTPAEVYASLAREGLAVRYLRVPVTDGKAPQPCDIDAIVKQVCVCVWIPCMPVTAALCCRLCCLLLCWRECVQLVMSGLG